MFGQPGTAPSSRSKPPERYSNACFHHALSVSVARPLQAEPVDLAEPAVPAAGDLPHVHDLRPPGGDAHRVPGAEQLELDLLVTRLLERVLHVVPLVHAVDVDELVEEQVPVRAHGSFRSSRSRRTGAAGRPCRPCPVDVMGTSSAPMMRQWVGTLNELSRGLGVAREVVDACTSCRRPARPAAATAAPAVADDVDDVRAPDVGDGVQRAPRPRSGTRSRRGP